MSYARSWQSISRGLSELKIPRGSVTDTLIRGTINAFGVFQTYYEANILSNKSPSDISWIGSIQAFLLLMVGVLTGPIFDAGHFRALIVTGCFLIPFGFMMLSLCHNYWQVLLAQAFVIGLGNGCLFVPSVAVLPQWFSTRKALANGVAASGSSIGKFLFFYRTCIRLAEIGFPLLVERSNRAEKCPFLQLPSSHC